MGTGCPQRNREEKTVNKSVRHISALVVLCTAISLFAACGGGENTKGDGTSGRNDATSGGGVTDSSTVDQYADLPDTTYGGKSIRMTSMEYTENGMPTQFDCDADETEKLLAAQYLRNRMIEEKYKVEFEEILLSGSFEQMSDKFNMAISSNTNEYELCQLIQRDAYRFAIQGYVIPSSELKYVDIEKPWYFKKINDALALKGEHFLAYSYECTNMLYQTNCVMFNPRILSENSLEDPYALVKAGTWTTEQFKKMARAAVRDLNNDGVYDPNDVLGSVGDYDNLYSGLIFGAGYKFVESGSDGVPEFTAPGNNALIDFLMNLYDYANEAGTTWDTTDPYTADYTNREDRDFIGDVFQNGHALFYLQSIGVMSKMADMKDSFGVVPLPKNSEQQKDYTSRNMDGWIRVVPQTNDSLDMTSVILEALAIESYNSTYKVYYDTILRSRYSQDDDTREMLDLITRTIDLDLGDTIFQDDIRWNIIPCYAYGGQNIFASRLAAINESANAVIDAYISAAG